MNPRAAQAARRVVAGGLAAIALGGCSVANPVPTWGLVKVAGTAATAAMASLPATAVNTVHHGDAPVSTVCIEFNRNAPLAELVPSLQAVLREQGVSSRVFEAGDGLRECRHWLRYVATVQWAVPPLSSDYRPYLSAATVSLHKASGALMASSSYDVDTSHGLGRWSSTRRKLSPVVKAVITGFDS
jgi:hypothetical protein